MTRKGRGSGACHPEIKTKSADSIGQSHCILHGLSQLLSMLVMVRCNLPELMSLM